MKPLHILGFSLLCGLVVYIGVKLSEPPPVYGQECPIDHVPMRLAKQVEYAMGTMVQQCWHCDECGHDILEYTENK